jgi:hypothetical protein
MAELAFPAPEPSDTEDVAWTLQTAGTMWARGDAHEAVRWLRRAAEAASDAGNDERALTLARSAADLSAATNMPASVAPPPVRPSPDETTRMQAPPPLSQTNNPIVPFDEAEGGMEGEYTIPDGLDAVERRPPPMPSSTRNPPPARPSTLPGRVNSRPRQALRVGVMPSPDDKNILIVRPLADDEPVPDGQHEALLTALEPGAHLLAKKR